jgi:DNA-binding XRE family transcriptional regulator
LISGKQIKVARVFLDWTQQGLAEKSGVSLATIQRMETSGLGRSILENAEKVKTALEKAGIEFIDQNDGGLAVRFRHPVPKTNPYLSQRQPAAPHKESSMISSKQIKVARAFLDWDQQDLAEKSGLHRQTTQRMETIGLGRSSLENVEKVKTALEKAGIEFIDKNDGGLGVRFRPPVRKD